MNNDTTKNLTDAKLLEETSGLVEFLIMNDLKLDSFELVKTLNEVFKQNKNLRQVYPEVFSFYKDCLIKAKFISLPLLGEDDICHLFGHYFNYVFKLEFYDLYGKVREKLTTIYDLEARDNFKRNIKEALLNNEEVLAGKYVQTGKEKRKPTVRNWLRDYIGEVGLGAANKLGQSQYLINSENVKRLSPAEKDKLKTLIIFYEKIKYSSKSPKGLEDSFTVILPNGELGTFRNGTIEKINPEAVKAIKNVIAGMDAAHPRRIDMGIDNLNKISSGFPEQSLEKRVIKEEISREEKIKNLRVIADSYPLNSLERKAVEEEINKIIIKIG